MFRSTPFPNAHAGPDLAQVEMPLPDPCGGELRELDIAEGGNDHRIGLPAIAVGGPSMHLHPVQIVAHRGAHRVGTDRCLFQAGELSHRAREPGARLLLRLPEIEDGCAIRVDDVVGGTQAVLHAPVADLVIAARKPRAAAHSLSIAERQARTDHCPIGRVARRQFLARGAGFE